jgi:hypothetical protein
MKRIFLLVSLIVTPSAVTLAQTTNSWIDGSGKWETGTNWSQATAPSISDAAEFITNATSKTVTIDGLTSAGSPATMTISNLTISSLATSNTLLLNKAGTITPLRVLNNLAINSGGVLVITNSALLVNGLAGGGIGDDGAVSLNSGSLLITNAATVVGVVGQGSFINRGGTWLALDVFVGDFPGARGMVVFAAGTNTLSGFLDLGNYGGSTGTVLVTDGLLVVTNGIHVGDGGVGQMTVSNGTVQGQQIYVGHLGGSQGTLTMAGGTNTLSSFLEVGGYPSGTGTVWVTGGQLVVTNDVTYVGNSGVGQLTISNGTVLANIVHVGNAAGSQGTLTIAGGSLLVTDDAHNAMTEVRYGTLTLTTGGVFVTDSLLITNASGRFINNGGTFSITGQAQVDQGTQTVASGTTQVSSNFVVGSTANSTGTVNITGGQLIVTNGVVGIGNNGTITGGSGVGLMIVSNGTLLASNILLGSSVGGQGEMILDNGGSIASVGTNAILICNDFGQIAGSLDWTNIGADMYCGYAHPGAYALSNGTASCQNFYVGYDNAGTMTIAGGSLSILSGLTVGHRGSPMSTGAVWITGGQLTMVNQPAIIGNSGVGQMTISNGTVTAADMVVGFSSNPGTLTLAGGTLTVNGIVLPNPNSQFIFSGGCLNANAITNANGQTLTAGNGAVPATWNLLGGITSLGNGLQVSANVTVLGFGTITGAVVNYGIIAPVGGTLNFQDFVTNYGLIITNGANFLGGFVNHGMFLDAAGDADGDGMNNLSEVLAGTNPTNSASVFHIMAVTRAGNDVLVNWSTVGGKRYVVQVSTGAGANYSSTFTTLSPVIAVPGTGESSTNYLDAGGATNSPSRYYRVRLVQ